MRQGRVATTWSTLVVSVAALLTIGLQPATASAVPSLKLKDRLLTVSDLPAGWLSHPAGATRVDFASSPCLRGLDSRSAAREKHATASFVEQSGLPALVESLAGGESAAEFHKSVDELARCRTLTLTIHAKHVKAAITRIALPVSAAGAQTFSLALTATDVPIGVDIVLFRAHAIVGEVLYLAVGTPTPVTAQAFANLAISKAEGRALTPPKTVSVVSSPVRVAHTPWGTIGYREVGSGPPLLLIMGFAGTMETWDPRFVDALAHDHEVVIFDNAGIGRTEPLPTPLTIDEMANQTSALIGALGLRKTAILGWSMGTMIAQALAVLHPAQVNRLVLCAAYPGTGTIEPTQKTIHDFTSGSPAEALGDLFPANQRSAATGYEVAVSDWPASLGASATVVEAQEKAILKWWTGADPAGRRTGTISVPTLIADGTRDRLDPQANARRLQKLFPRAQVVLYPDAGHAFLFQDETDVVRKVEAFLAS
jgi:pimeloyl-ACP methyl ester carboxylesterase